MKEETLKAIEGYNKEKELIVAQISKCMENNDYAGHLYSRLKEIDVAIAKLLTQGNTK